MVLMEIINLDDTGDINEGEIRACSSSTPMARAKRSPSKGSVNKKNGRIRKKMRLLKELLNRSVSNRTNDSDETLNGSQLSCCNKRTSTSKKKKSFRKLNNQDGNIKIVSPRRKKRKMSTNDVVVIDSDDDCVVLSKKKSSKENNNVGEDILCLSDASVIELSDSEDVGVVAGTVETVSTPWENQGKTVNILNTHRTQQSSSTLSNINILRHKLRKVIQSSQKNYQNCKDVAGTSNQLSVASPSQSISYIPVDSDSLAPKTGPRPIIIDGSNVAFGHGKDQFSSKGIEICINFFLRRKHTEIRAFVPQFRRRHHATTNIEIMDKLEKSGYIVYTPSRQVGNQRITSYDDRYVVEYAAKTGGIIVTRDNYKDLLLENQAWRDTISKRILPYTFVGDMIMFPKDPLGRGGPPLDKFLMY